MLVRIVSLLRIKEAMHTCVLSKRWRKTWTSLPDLRISSLDFLPNGRLPVEEVRAHETKFEQFVRGVLCNREGPHLDKFMLFWQSREFGICVSCTSETAKDCILHAMEFKPPVLSLGFCSHKISSNYAIFSCTFLEEVMIACADWRGIDFEIAPESVHLPFLKKLHLTFVTIYDDFLDKIFLGCPIMGEFGLLNCNLNVSKISSSTLKKLLLVGCRRAKNLEICSPILTDLIITTCELQMGRIFLKLMPFLYNATIDFSCCTYSDVLAVTGSENLNYLSNVTTLDLQLKGTDFQGLLEKRHWPIFKNLKSLKLGGWCLNSDFRLVVFFLRSPNLQMIMLHYKDVFEVANAEKLCLKEPEEAIVQREQLEIVKIIKYEMSDEWFDQLVNKLHAHVKTIGKIIII